MITIIGNKLVGNNLEQQFLQNIVKDNYKYCDVHGTYFHNGLCSFCENKLLETFYIQLEDLIVVKNAVVLDIDEKEINNQLYNAGISSYDQEINAKYIQENLATYYDNKQHILAQNLNLYTKDEINQLIQRLLDQVEDNKDEVDLDLDYWEISKTKSYAQRALEICDQLSLTNCYFIYTGKKSQFLKFKQCDYNPKIIADDGLVEEFNKKVKGEILVIENGKQKFPEVLESQIKRVFSCSLPEIQSKPFNGSIVYITNGRRDLLQSAQKFGKQHSEFHVYCKENDKDFYYNFGGTTGGTVNSLNEANIQNYIYRIRVVGSNNIIFQDSQSNSIELKLLDKQNINLIFEKSDKKSAFIQVVVLRQDGICLIQQLEVSNQDDVYEPSAFQQKEDSVFTLKLTEYSKQQ